MHKYLEMAGSGLCTFTFLQAQVNPNLQSTQQLIVSAIIAVSSNLLIKWGNKLIQRRRYKKRINPHKRKQTV